MNALTAVPAMSATTTILMNVPRVQELMYEGQDFMANGPKLEFTDGHSGR
jgi:hypothetical protein